MTPFVPHNCEHCGGPVPKRGNESNAQCNARKFCSNKCRGDGRKKTYVPVHCQVCGVKLIKARGPSYAEYAARKVCNAESCKSEWKHRRRAKLRTAVPLLSLAMRAWR